MHRRVQSVLWNICLRISRLLSKLRYIRLITNLYHNLVAQCIFDFCHSNVFINFYFHKLSRSSFNVIKPHKSTMNHVRLAISYFSFRVIKKKQFVMASCFVFSFYKRNMSAFSCFVYAWWRIHLVEIG